MNLAQLSNRRITGYLNKVRLQEPMPIGSRIHYKRVILYVAYPFYVNVHSNYQSSNAIFVINW